MKLVIYDHGPARRQPLSVPRLSLAKDGRLYLSQALREKLGIVEGEPFQAYLAYDEDTGNILLGRVGAVKVDENVKWVTFTPGGRYTAFVKKFLEDFKLNIKETVHYNYIEKWNGWYVFRRADLDEPEAS